MDLSLPLRAEIRDAHGDFREWLFDAALPFWTRVALDKQGPGFCEHLDLDGLPAQVGYKRLRVQARQIYVFSQASMLGWKDGVEVAAQGYAFIKTCALQAGGAWAKTLRRDGSVLDPTVDLYDLASVLFSLAWFARATGDEEPLSLARHTLAWMDQYMVHERGGYAESMPRLPGPRLQNSHMHMFEAALALYETSPEPTYALCASNMLGLFRAHFRDASCGAMGEYYTDSLAPIPGPDGQRVEPGHLYEWVWLLRQAKTLLGHETLEDQKALYDFAGTYGVLGTGPAIVDAVSRAGSPMLSSRRLWPQTEAIKAHCVRLLDGDVASARRVVQGIQHLLMTHLSGCPDGTWRETFSDRGIANADKIPASSLYHVLMAYSEVSKLVSRV